MSLKCEPASEPLRISVKQMLIDRWSKAVWESRTHQAEQALLKVLPVGFSDCLRPPVDDREREARERDNRLRAFRPLPSDGGITTRARLSRSFSSASERGGETFVWTACERKPRPESGLDCLVCAIFARQRRERGQPFSGCFSPASARGGNNLQKQRTLRDINPDFRDFHPHNGSSRFRIPGMNVTCVPNGTTFRGRDWYTLLDEPVLTLDDLR
jgi:hypothetical protein